MKANPLFGDKVPRDAARRRYEALVDEVSRIINEADPKSLLEIGAPTDEYSPEVGTIVPRVVKATGPHEVSLIMFEEFERWFGEGSVGPRDAFDEAANAVWQAVLDFKGAV
jgi:hypothetical protein